MRRRRSPATEVGDASASQPHHDADRPQQTLLRRPFFVEDRFNFRHPFGRTSSRTGSTFPRTPSSRPDRLSSESIRRVLAPARIGDQRGSCDSSQPLGGCGHDDRSLMRSQAASPLFAVVCLTDDRSRGGNLRLFDQQARRRWPASGNSTDGVLQRFVFNHDLDSGFLQGKLDRVRLNRVSSTIRLNEFSVGDGHGEPFSVRHAEFQTIRRQLMLLPLGSSR